MVFPPRGLPGFPIFVFVKVVEFLLHSYVSCALHYQWLINVLGSNFEIADFSSSCIPLRFLWFSFRMWTFDQTEVSVRNWTIFHPCMANCTSIWRISSLQKKKVTDKRSASDNFVLNFHFSYNLVRIGQFGIGSKFKLLFQVICTILCGLDLLNLCAISWYIAH